MTDVEAKNHETLRAYQLAFGSPAGLEVLADLAAFCRAAESCFHADPRMHAMLEGRREVFLRIQSRLNLTQKQLYALAQGHRIFEVKEETDDDQAD